MRLAQLIQSTPRALFAIFCMVASSGSSAAPASYVINGRIIKADDSPLEAPLVNFTIQVLSDLNQCLLYEENHSLNMTGSQGVFGLSLGSGVDTGAGGLTDAVEAFDNGLDNQTGLTCASGTTYDPAPGDKRRVRVTFDEGGGPILVSQDQIIESIPYAQYANSLEGKGLSEIIQVNTTTAGLNQTNLETIFDGGATFTELQALLAGTSAQYTSASPSSPVDFNNQVGSNVGTPVAGTDAANKDYVDQNVGGYTIDLSGVSTLAGNGSTLIWDQASGSWTTGTASSTDSTKLPLAGGVMTGDITMSSGAGINLDNGSLLNAGSINMTGQFVSWNGEVTLPSISFVGDTDTGFYYAGGINIAVDGVNRGIFTDTSYTSTVPLRAGGGSAASPEFADTNNTDTGMFFPTPTGGEIAFSNDGTETMRLDGSGNLGLGTTLPSQFVNLKNDQNASSVLLFENLNTGPLAASMFELESDGGSGYIYRTSAAYGVTLSADRLIIADDDAIDFKTGGSTDSRLHIDASGNVGIGTISPGYKLDVAGSIASGPKGSSAGDGGAMIYRELTANGTNSVGFRAPDAIAADVLWQLPAADGTSGQVLQTNGAGVLGWASVTGGGGGYSAGDTILAADGSAAAPGFAFSSATSTGFYRASSSLQMAVNGNQRVSIDSDTNRLSMRLGPSGDGIFSNDDLYLVGDANGTGSGAIRFGTGTNIKSSITELMRIDVATGNVGIGATNPGELLHLENSAPRIQFVDTDTGADSYISASSANGSLFLRADDNNEQSNSEIGFDIDGAFQMRLDDQGRLGIGDNTADAHLEISANGGTTGSVLMVSSDDNNDGDLLIVNENGNVGIGTTSPGAELDVTGTGAIIVPAGDTAQRPGSPQNGMIRYNSDNNKMEAYENGVWADLVNAGGSGDLTNGGNDGAIIVGSDNNTLALESNNVTALSFDTSQNATLTGQLRAANGTVGAPGISFASDPDTGFYSTAPDRIDISRGGVNEGVFRWNVFEYDGVFRAGLAASNPGDPTFASRGDIDSGLYLPGSDVLHLNTSGIERLTADATGNVGIGTTIPTQTLDVSGSIASGPKGTTTGDGGAMIFRELAANGTNSVGFRAADAIAADVLWELPATDGAANQVLQTNGSGVLGWASITSVGGDFMADGSVAMTAAFQAATGSSGAPSITFDGDEDTGLFNESAGRMAVSTNGSRTSWFTDSGIHTYRSVSSATASGGRFTANSATFPTAADQKLGGYEFTSDFGVTNSASMEAYTSEVWVSSTAQGSYLTFSTTDNGSTSSTEKMRINPFGRVGIGTTIPEAKLDIDSSADPVVRLKTGGLSGTQVGLLFDDMGTNRSSRIQWKNSGDTELGYINFKNGNSGEEDSMTLQVSTNYFTVSQMNDADMNTAAGHLRYVVNKNAGGTDTGLLIDKTTVNSTSTSLLIDGQTDAVSQFWVSDAGAAYFSGSLGIGTISADEELDVVGDFELARDDGLRAYRFRTSGGQLDTEFFGRDWIVSAWTGSNYGGTQNYYLRLYDNTHTASALGNWTFRQGSTFADTSSGNPILHIDSSGGLMGVGTTAPESLLHIDGSGAGQGLCVTSDDTCSAVPAGGQISAETTLNTGADYAEYFAAEELMQPGDIVGLNTENGKVRIHRDGDILVGIVSTDPGVIGNSELGSQPDSVLVALVGQVPFSQSQTQVKQGFVYTHDDLPLGPLLSDGKVYIQVSSIDTYQKRRMASLESRLTQKIDSQKLEIDQLKLHNQELRDRLDHLESLVNSLSK